MSTTTVRVTGSFSAEEIAEALQVKFGDRKVVIESKGNPGADEIYVSNDSDFEAVRTQLVKRNKEIDELEELNSKALSSIQSLHKHQRDLFDQFVVLRQKYDEQKNTLMSILWTHLSQHHPELRQIPPMEDPETFIETEERVGKYEVGPVLGEGQFASVYTCRKEGSDKEMALKSVKKERIMTFHGMKRMSTEIKTLRMLQSKYIVCMDDVFQSANNLYIVTEKGGSDLFEFFDEHPSGVPENWAREIIYRVMRAVLFCHQRQYCHRDLKPENILMEFDPNSGVCTDLKLCDFGLSIPFRERSVMSDFCGSPGFFAPEMITKGSYFGDKADIWSIGCILLELVLGNEKFCDVWMCAYDYDLLQDNEKFAEAIQEAVNSLPDVLTFTETLNDFVMSILKLRSSERPSLLELLQHPWFETVDSRTSACFSVDEGSTPMLSINIGDEDSPGGTPGLKPRPRFNSVDSYVSSPDGVNSCNQSPPNGMLAIKDPKNALRSPETIVGTAEWQMTQRELVKGSYSERERKLLEDYSDKKLEEKDDDRVYHLPPIEPPTPSLSKAKKILQQGDSLLDRVNKGQILEGVTEEQEEPSEKEKDQVQRKPPMEVEKVLRRSDNNSSGSDRGTHEMVVSRSYTT